MYFYEKLIFLTLYLNEKVVKEAAERERGGDNKVRREEDTQREI
jgi:hypothetical protein